VFSDVRMFYKASSVGCGRRELFLGNSKQWLERDRVLQIEIR
jgi:hypothetical protein